MNQQVPHYANEMQAGRSVEGALYNSPSDLSRSLKRTKIEQIEPNHFVEHRNKQQAPIYDLEQTENPELIKSLQARSRNFGPT